MKRGYISTGICGLISLFLLGLAMVGNAQFEPPSGEQFAEYWYAGEAELVRFDLEQARYGAIHTSGAEAVQIYVTEDFLPKKQVKADDWRDPSTVKVLKINNLRDFHTGLYEYRLMTSVFTPVKWLEHPYSLKLTTSIQDWCGQAFTQLNLRGKRYEVLLRSYFESEGDEEWKIPATLLEDEVWTKLRLDPTKLPTGEVDVIPAMRYFRFMHRKIAPLQARAELREVDSSEFSDSPHALYEIDYQGDPRVFTVWFEKEFPYRILGWTETGSGADEGLVTKGTAKEVLKIDYWTRNAPADTALRGELGLDE